MPAMLASTLLMAAHVQAAETTSTDTMIVSANAGESVTAPLKGMVAKESASGTKTSTPLIKNPAVGHRSDPRPDGRAGGFLRF